MSQDELVKLLQEKTALQQQLIEAQQEIIRLHEKVEQMTPPTPPDDANFHRIHGMTSEEAFNSNKLENLQALYDWCFDFGNTYIKPYVHLRTFAELMAHMTRGLNRKIAILEVKAEFEMLDEAEDKGDTPESTEPTSTSSEAETTEAGNDTEDNQTPQQAPLFKDDK